MPVWSLAQCPMNSGSLRSGRGWIGLLKNSKIAVADDGVINCRCQLLLSLSVSQMFSSHVVRGDVFSKKEASFCSDFSSSCAFLHSTTKKRTTAITLESWSAGQPSFEALLLNSKVVAALVFERDSKSLPVGRVTLFCFCWELFYVYTKEHSVT